ncbi:MAG: hypothetical protein CVV44_18890 [Spirochaetae bacterium HGW-Spirochaetae-1]|jgi:hypothetical protein|nr:MAG: hypothetical protein CVV44_18890 [Spirochaetae bacterium HGW-Spirochaetae-1]
MIVFFRLCDMVISTENCQEILYVIAYDKESMVIVMAGCRSIGDRVMVGVMVKKRERDGLCR